MADIDWDDSDFKEGLSRLTDVMNKAIKNGVFEAAGELMRISAREIPHKDGLLMNSASSEWVSEEEIIVGYNKSYAAYQHEGHWPDGTHVIKTHSKPDRKTKYLEDPLKLNLETFRKHIESNVGQGL